MLLTEHKSRAIFDLYNIIHEQELLDVPGTRWPPGTARGQPLLDTAPVAFDLGCWGPTSPSRCSGSLLVPHLSAQARFVRGLTR